MVGTGVGALLAYRKLRPDLADKREFTRSRVRKWEERSLHRSNMTECYEKCAQLAFTRKSGMQDKIGCSLARGKRLRYSGSEEWVQVKK